MKRISNEGIGIWCTSSGYMKAGRKVTPGEVAQKKYSKYTFPCSGDRLEYLKHLKNCYMNSLISFSVNQGCVPRIKHEKSGNAPHLCHRYKPVLSDLTFESGV